MTRLELSCSVHILYCQGKERRVESNGINGLVAAATNRKSGGGVSRIGFTTFTPRSKRARNCGQGREKRIARKREEGRE